jgi:hypothetical protein
MIMKKIVSIALTLTVLSSLVVYAFACDPSLYGSNVTKYNKGSSAPWDDARASTSVAVSNQHSGQPLRNDLNARATLYYKDGGTLKSRTYAKPVVNYFSTDTGWVTVDSIDYAVKVEHTVWTRCNNCGTIDGPVMYTSGNGTNNMTSNYAFTNYKW